MKDFILVQWHKHGFGMLWIVVYAAFLLFGLYVGFLSLAVKF